MRLGVLGKVMLALGVLLLAFAGNATFTLLSIHRARQGVVANEAYLELQGSVDAAWKSLNDFAPALGRGTASRLDPNLPLALRMGRKYIDDALGAIDRYLEKEPTSARRAEFQSRREQLASLGRQMDGLAGDLAAAAAATDTKAPHARTEFESHFAGLTHSLNRLRRPLRGESGQIAQRLSDDEETALSMALALGAAGLAVAGAAFIFTLRTLRPLGVLRTRAREVAGGDYARRTGVTSQDEIGDLAREFDAMAAAVQERERRLIRSERLATVGRMAAQIAHEVRNPLSSIGLNAELLGDEIGQQGKQGNDGAQGDGGAEARRLLASISSEVDRLAEITETYLRFARLPRPKLEREDLGAIVSAVVEQSRGELTQDRVEVDLRVAPGLPEVPADEAQIRQALLNLIRNAREAMASEAAPADRSRRLEISVDLETERRQVVVRVRDSGPGIREADLGKIFDPFFSTKQRGTGLGLALVQEIVVEHGGQIDVQSRPGEGTTFLLRFPVDDERLLGGAPAVGGGAGAIADGVVEGSELVVEQGGVARVKGEGAFERGGASGALPRGSEGAA
jgi:signal transduction histidine kinase